MKTIMMSYRNWIGQVHRVVLSLCAFLFIGNGIIWALEPKDSIINGINYHVDNGGTVTVIAHPSYKYYGDVVIPDSIFICGKKRCVFEIGEAFLGCHKLTSISIPRTVHYIWSCAFKDCVSLTSINLSNVSYIDGHAFVGCKNLVSIVIPESVYYIGEGAFKNCGYPKSVYISNLEKFLSILSHHDIENGSYVLANSRLYLNGEEVTHLVIPNSITKISDYFFKSFLISSISFPNTLRYIGSYSFEGCSNLQSVKIPESVVGLGAYAFSYCSGLTQVELPNSIENIPPYAFQYCRALESIIIPEGIKAIRAGAFFCCNDLKDVSIPTTLTEIGGSAFARCQNLQEIVIPNGVRTIRKQAFESCSNLERVMIGCSVETIGLDAFNLCNKLSSITSLNPVPPTCASDFPNYDIPLYVPKGMADAYRNAEIWKNFNNIIEKDNIVNHIEYSKDEKTMEKIYDLQGRRVLTPQRGGLYIRGGKKFIY